MDVFKNVIVIGDININILEENNVVDNYKITEIENNRKYCVLFGPSFC